eukprot:3141511-Heterocapsa_arctica.AAC.1
MHVVPEGLVQEVLAQDKLVTELLSVMLDIMRRVHDKAPVIKKDDKQKKDEVRRSWLHGPKVGIHGPRCLVDREAGGWGCLECVKYITTHTGWR